MYEYISSLDKRLILFYKSICLIIIVTLLFGQQFLVFQATAQSSTSIRRVNIPYLGSTPPTSAFTPAIFWFGKVGPTSNYADVRMYYYDQYLGVVVHVIDSRLYYDTNPSASDLTSWDAISLYLNLDGNIGETPGKNAYRFDGQLNNGEPRNDWQDSYQGNGSAWFPSSTSFNTTSFWRGNYPNDTVDDRGWSITFQIPFSSLGLSNRPDDGTIWGLGVVLHDRDDAAGTPITPEVWPETLDPNRPSSWGQLSFGFPQYKTPIAIPGGTLTIRNGSSGASVSDAAVGGGFNCGADYYGPNFWNSWGNANYANDSQINIQNQWDISDWPCFSKYYVTYPLDSVPKGQVIISAILTMYQTGNSWGGSNPTDSYIQVFTVGNAWNASTITWNNAPLANENISGTWVHAKTTNNWPTYTWDVSRAVAEAYAAGKPLRLALYSADGDYHSGKYFSSSDWPEVKARPFLSVRWGSACDSANITCKFSFLPLTIR